MMAGTQGVAATGASAPVRSTRRIFLGVVLATTGVYAGVTTAPVVAHELTGSALLAGLPVAALLAGAGAGAAVMGPVVARRGRRPAMVGSYAVGAVACLVAAVAAGSSLFGLLLAGLLGAGVGHAANQMARYGAAELHPPARRPAVIGWIVWAQAVGAVAGPLLLGPVARLGSGFGLPGPATAFALAAGLFALALGLHARTPVPAAAPADADPAEPAPPEPPPVVASAGDYRLWASPAVQVAATALVTAQVVMLLVMTMTPVHARGAGHGLGAVGGIMSAHTFGMFGLAPVAGRMAGRLGSGPTIGGGLALLAVGSVYAAAAPASAPVLLGLALFVLGLGWSLTFVAASALLSREVDAAVRDRLQSRVEALTWTSGAAASVLSGIALGLVGFRMLALAAAALLLAPTALMLARRRVAAAA